MVDRLNWLAWLVAAAAILAWAFLPTLGQAGTVIVPNAPIVEATVLAPPVPLPEGDTSHGNAMGRMAASGG